MTPPPGLWGLPGRAPARPAPGSPLGHGAAEEPVCGRALASSGERQPARAGAGTAPPAALHRGCPPRFGDAAHLGEVMAVTSSYRH